MTWCSGHEKLWNTQLMTSPPFLPRPFLLWLYLLQFTLLINVFKTIQGSGERITLWKSWNYFSLGPRLGQVLHEIDTTPASKVLIWGNQNSLRLVLRQTRNGYSYRGTSQSLRAGGSVQLPGRRELGRRAFALPLLFLLVRLFSARPPLSCVCRQHPATPAHPKATFPGSAGPSSTHASTPVPHSFGLGRDRVLYYKQGWRSPSYGGGDNS